MEHRIRPDETVTEAVVDAVSSFEGVPARSLPPLYEAVDTDAPDAAFEPLGERSRDRSGRITFVYHDNLVTVESSGRVTVEPRSDEPFAVEVGAED